MNWYKKSFSYYKLQLHKFADYEDEWQSQVESLAANNPYPFKHLFVNGGNRIYLPFGIDGGDESADRDVKAILEENGYKITDYRGGYCSDGRNTFKIGKVLNKLWKNDIQDLQRKFENDEIYNLEREIESDNQYYQGIINTFQNSSYRVGKQVSGFSVVISQDPNDVAKMSTDRDWTSCMQLGTGQYYRDVFCEVQEGGLVAYLINSNDTEITKPLARIRIRRFASDDGRNVLAPEEAVYGNEVKGFQQFVKNWVKSVQGDISEGLYYLKGGEWSDTFSKSMFVMPNNEEDILRCWRGEVDTSSYVRYKVMDELEGEDDEYGEIETGFPKYFSTEEEAQQFINSIDGDDGWREMHGDYWLEEDEDGEWTYDRYEIRRDVTMTKDTIKGQAALLIANAPKGEYAAELINEIKDWSFENRNLSSTKRTVVNTLFAKYPEIFSYEEAQMEGTAREYEFVKEMPDGPEKDMIKQNILNNIKTRLSDITKLFTANDRVMTPDLRLEVNFSEYIDSPLKELFSPIPGDVTKLLIDMANRLKNDEPLGLDKLPDEQLDHIYRGDKKIEESMLTHDARLSLCSKIIRLFDSTNTDVPEIQAFYESLLPEWGYNRKQQGFEHAFPPYSTINVESLGYAIGKLGENGTKFLPFLKERLKEEQVLLEKVEGDKISNYLYGKGVVTKNVEKYLYIINSIENGSGFSQKYKFFSALNWYKTAQISFSPFVPLDDSLPEERQRIKDLSNKIDWAYQSGNYQDVEDMEEELERLIEKVTMRTEEIVNEGYSVEGQGADDREEASLEELLAQNYGEYLDAQKGIGPYSADEILNNMRSNVMMFGGNPKINSETVLDAAKDAYERKKQLRERKKPIAAKSQHWYKKAKLKKRASMTLHVENFPYQDDLSTLGSLTNKAQQMMWPFMSEFLDDETLKVWKSKVSTEWFTPDGNDYFNKNGIINLYLPNIPEESFALIIQTAKQILEKLNLEISNVKSDKSKMYDADVIRFGVSENKNEKPVEPPTINLANTNAYHIFRDTLGYQKDLWDDGSFDIKELKGRITYYLGEASYPEKTPEEIENANVSIQQGLFGGQPLKGDEWKQPDIRDMLSGRGGISQYSQEDTKERLEQILNFCNWALDKGYDKAYLA